MAKISHKLHALCWVVAGAVTYVASDIGTVLLSSPAVDRIFLALGGVAAGVVLSVYFYLAIYLTYIVRIRLDWSIYAPGMIPLATASGLLAALSFAVALWPVYGMLTPAVLALLFMGGIMTTHFIPLP